MDILSVVIPFFALVFIGFLAARSRVLPLDAVPGLNVYVLYFALSAMLFQFGAQIPVAELLNPVVIVVWLISGLLVMTLAIVTGLRRRFGWLDASFGGLIAVLPNSGFMGLPLISTLLGDEAAGPIITSLLVDIVLIQSIALALSQQNDSTTSSFSAQIGPVLKRVLTNPMPWAIVLGAAWGMTGLQMSGPLDEIVSMLAASATPVALFTIGAVLARERMITGPGDRQETGWFPSGDVGWLTSLKLLVHPLVVWILGRGAISAGLPLSEFTLLVLVLVAALPTAANASMLAERFGADNGRIAMVILASTALGFVTFTVAVALLV